jgi:parallel beta-helix repeat protein
MTAHPINAVLVDGSSPSKSSMRTYMQARLALVLVNASEILSIDMGSTVAAMLATTGQLYRYDATDTTTPHNGLTVLVDVTGRRFKIVTPSSLRANVYTNIISNALTAPPGSPSEGDAYIVAPAATGAWAAKDNNVAVWSSGQWWFDVPRPGAFAWVGGLYVFGGASWASVSQSKAYGNVLNVMAFGAKGDGTTDDSGAIQAAINAASSGSAQSVVYLPDAPGGYALNATLTLPGGVSLIGDNKRGLQLSRIKPEPSFTAPLLQTTAYGSVRQLRCRVEGLFFDGSSTTLTALQMNCQESVFRDLTIKNCFTYGIQVGGVGGGTSQQALNNHLTDLFLAGVSGTVSFYDGILLDYYTADTTVERVYVESCTDACIRSRGYNDRIVGNHLYSANYGIYSETSSDKTIIGNYIEAQAKAGVIIAGGGSDTATLGLVMQGNVFRNINTAGGTSGVVILQGSYMNAINISGNAVRRDASTGYSTPYFVYYNGITLAGTEVVGNNVYQTGVVTTGQHN